MRTNVRDSSSSWDEKKEQLKSDRKQIIRMIEVCHDMTAKSRELIRQSMVLLNTRSSDV